MTASKAQKIVRRTLMGSTLVATLALLLWLLSRSSDGKTLFYAVSVILAVAVLEMNRLGTYKDRNFGPALALSALGAVLLLGAVIRDQTLLRDLGAGLELRALAARPGLVSMYAWAGALAALAFALFRTSRSILSLGRPSATPWITIVARLVSYAVLALAIAFVTVDELEAASRLPFVWLIAGIVMLASIPLLMREERGVADLVAVTALALWLVPPLPLLWDVWHGFGLSALISLLILSKVGDTAGYYVGSAIGRTHPFPKISPGKTTAGCVGSFVAATVIGGILSATGMLPTAAWGVGAGLVAGASTNLAAQAGDLLESWIKRRAGVKDSSALLGPSGGVLDQIDSLLVSVPVSALVWPWLFAAAP